MKRLAALISCLLLVIAADAQQELQKSSGEMQTLFGKSGEPHIGWVIGIDQAYTQFDNRDVWMSGLKFGMVRDLHMINTPDDMMNNFTFMMGLKFGKF